MSIQLVVHRPQLLLPAMLLILGALFAPVASALEPPADPKGAASISGNRCAVVAEADETDDIGRAAALPTLGGSPVRLLLIRGVVEPIEKDLFGRPQRVAIVFVSSNGFLVQNPVEDVAAGEQLKDHVGEDVTVRGALLVKADGRPALLIDAFQVNGSRDEGRED
jgi:hypothetical protein